MNGNEDLRNGLSSAELITPLRPWTRYRSRDHSIRSCARRLFSALLPRLEKPAVAEIDVDATLI